MIQLKISKIFLNWKEKTKQLKKKKTFEGVRTLLETDEEHFYGSMKIKCAFKNNYIKHNSSGDR